MDQRRMWDYYQGPGISSFEGSINRLRFLVSIAGKLAGTSRWRVLNIGTGNGWLERECQRRNWQTLALDPSYVALDQLRHDHIPGTLGLIEELPLADASLDAVFCSEVLEHLTDTQLERGLGEIVRVLKPDGYLIGTVPFNERLAGAEVVCPSCGERFHRWGHHQSFDRRRIRSLLEQRGLCVQRVTIRAFPFFPERSLLNSAKRLIVDVIGRFGVQAAFPSLIFVGQRRI